MTHILKKANIIYERVWDKNKREGDTISTLSLVDMLWYSSGEFPDWYALIAHNLSQNTQQMSLFSLDKFENVLGRNPAIPLISYFTYPFCINISHCHPGN